MMVANEGSYVQQILRRVEREARHYVSVRFAGHRFEFSTNALRHIDWIRSYTGSQYRVDPAPPGRAAHLTSFDHASFESQVRGRLRAMPRRRVTLYQGYPADEIELGFGWVAWMHKSRPNIILCSRRSCRCVTLGTSDDVESKAEPMRCVREMFTKDVERDGHFVFHAGSVDIEGNGIAICGVAGAGKSTTVVSLVEAGASYLSNDRSYIGVKEGELWIHPWPTTAAVGMGTLYHFPGLRSWMERGGGWAYEPQGRLTDVARHSHLGALTSSELATLPDKLELTSEELTRSLGSSIGTSAQLSCIVFPQIELGRRDVVLEKTQSQVAAETLLSQCLSIRDDSYPDWLRWRTLGQAYLASAARSLIDRIVKNTLCVSLRFGDLRGERGRRASDDLIRLSRKWVRQERSERMKEREMYHVCFKH